MATITINPISNDDILSSQDFSTNLSITGNTTGITSGTIITLNIIGKLLTSTVQSDFTYSFSVPTNYPTNHPETELSLLDFVDKHSYICTIYTDDISTQKSFFVDLSTGVMSYDKFLNGDGAYPGIPQDGDIINATNVNVGPIQNRTDLIYLDSKIGDVNSIIDQKSDTYDSRIDNDLVNPNATISNAVSQLRVDVGNKNLLTTTEKTSLVGAINELKKDMYRPSQALNLVAHYDYQTNGNYVLNGCNITGLNTNISDIPSDYEIRKQFPYLALRHSSCYPTSSTKYNSFSISQGKALVKGYEVFFKNSMNMYFQNTMSDEQPNHKRRFEYEMAAVKTSAITSYNGYTIRSGKNIITGLYSLEGIEGELFYPTEFTTTVSNAAILTTIIKSFLLNTHGVDFSDVNILDIPNTVMVNGLEVNIELDGEGIKFLGDPQNPADSFSIPVNELKLQGVLSGSLLASVSYIKDTKDIFYLENKYNFINTTMKVSFDRILKRFDKIYLTVNNTDYNPKYWNENFNYALNDVVEYSGSMYRSLSNNNFNSTPTDLTTWINIGMASEGVAIQPIFYYVEGYNNKEGFPVIPSLNDIDVLDLCTIVNEYGQNVKIISTDNRAYKMVDIKNLESTLDDAVYNLARLQSTQNLSYTDSVLSKDMFIDPMFDDDLRDVNLELAHVDSGVSKSGTIKNGVLTHGITFANISEIISSEIQAKKLFVQLDDFEITGSYLASQLDYSRSILINQYQVTQVPKVELTVSPRTFTWIDSQKINNYKERNATLNGAKVDYSTVSSIVNNSVTVDNSSWWQINTTTTTTTVTESKDFRTETIDTLINEPRKVPQYTLSIKAPNYSFNGGEQLAIKLGDAGELYGLSTGNFITSNDLGGLDIVVNVGGEVFPLLSGDRTLTVEGIGVPNGTDEPDHISRARGAVSIEQQPFLRTINNYDIINKDILRVTTTHVEAISWGGDGGGDGGDPLAQTFIAPSSSYIHSLYVMVDAVDGNNADITNETAENYVNQKILIDGKLPEDINILLYGTTAGYPDHEKLLATGSLPRGSFVHQITPDWDKIEFRPKVKLEQGKTYAAVIATNYESIKREKKVGSVWETVTGFEDGIRLKLRSIRLGDNFPNPGLKNIKYNSHKFIDGILFSSSNTSAWTPHQPDDLTFKISECKFILPALGYKEVLFDKNTSVITNVTDIVTLVGAKEPGKTYIDLILKHGPSTTLTNTLNVINGEHIMLDTKIDTVGSHQLIARLKTDESYTLNGATKLVADTPSLYCNASVFFGSIDPISVYVSKNIDLVNSLAPVSKKLKLYLDIDNFDIDRVKIYYNLNAIITNESWVEMVLDNTYEGPEIEKRFLCNNTDTAVSIGDNLRIKIVLKTDINNPLELKSRIGVRNLRLIAY